MFCSFFYSFSPSVSWGHLTVLNKPGQPHLGPSSNHFKREQRPFLVQLGTVSLCLSCQGYFGLQLSLARACYGDLFSGTRCLEWLPSPNRALSYHHGPTWTSLTWLMNWFLILPSWFDLGSALSAFFCLMSGLLFAVSAWLTWGCGAGCGVTSIPGLPSLGGKTSFCCFLFCFLQVCVWVHRGEALCCHSDRRWWLLPTPQKCSKWSHLFA